MDEQSLWDVMATLGGKADKKALKHFGTRLNQLSPEDVTAFGDELSAKLYALDTEAHFKQPILADEAADAEPEDMDGDLFDDLRCAVVLAGQDVYESVLARPQALTEHRWPQLWDAGAIIDVLDAVHKERSIGTGSYSPKFPLDTGSNPLGFQENPTPRDNSPSEPADRVWLLLGYTYEDPAFERKWDTAKNWPRFERPVEAALQSLMTSADRRRAFEALGVKRVLLQLELHPASHKANLKVRRVADELEVSTIVHFGFSDPSSDEIQNWAAAALTEALDTALEKSQ